MHMQVLRLLAARRAVPAITSAADACCCHESLQEQHYDDEGPFFDLDFRASSVRASSAGSGSDSDESCDFVISLQRSRSSSALPPFQEPKRGKLVGLRTLSFGARPKAAHFPRRRSSCSSSSSSSSARSSSLTLRLFMETPDHTEEDDAVESPRSRRAAPSGDAIIRRCLSSISRRLTRFRTVDGARRLRKCRSAPAPAPASRSDDSALQTQDGIAGAIAHCKESLHRAA